MNRPWNASLFFGAMFATGLIEGEVDQGPGPFGGFRFGRDFDPYLGAETRFGFAGPAVEYPGSSALTRDNSHIFLWDLDVLYYPFGDAQIRPYGLLGFGLAQFDFETADGGNENIGVLGMPFGVGVKYLWHERAALRVELLDNVAFSGAAALDTMHNISLTAGAEFRFGGPRLSYWPWNPTSRLTH